MNQIEENPQVFLEGVSP